MTIESLTKGIANLKWLIATKATPEQVPALKTELARMEEWLSEFEVGVEW